MGNLTPKKRKARDIPQKKKQQRRDVSGSQKGGHIGIKGLEKEGRGEGNKHKRRGRKEEGKPYVGDKLLKCEKKIDRPAADEKRKSRRHRVHR